MFSYFKVLAKVQSIKKVSRTKKNLYVYKLSLKDMHGHSLEFNSREFDTPYGLLINSKVLTLIKKNNNQIKVYLLRDIIRKILNIFLMLIWLLFNVFILNHINQGEFYVYYKEHFFIFVFPIVGYYLLFKIWRIIIRNMRFSENGGTINGKIKSFLKEYDSDVTGK